LLTNTFLALSVLQEYTSCKWKLQVIAPKKQKGLTEAEKTWTIKKSVLVHNAACGGKVVKPLPPKTSCSEHKSAAAGDGDERGWQLEQKELEMVKQKQEEQREKAKAKVKAKAKAEQKLKLKQKQEVAEAQTISPNSFCRHRRNSTRNSCRDCEGRAGAPEEEAANFL